MYQSPPLSHWPDGSCPLGGEKLQRVVLGSPLLVEDGTGCFLGSFPDLPIIAGLPSASPGCFSKGSPEKKLKKGAQVSRLLSKSITQSLKLSILPLVEAITFSQAVTV